MTMDTATLTREDEMPDTPSYQEALFWRLGTFRPSDRMEFERAFQSSSGRDAAFNALVQFVERWENADWLEDYSIERIGKWLAKNAPAETYEQLVDWASQQPSAARSALIKGLQTRRIFA